MRQKFTTIIALLLAVIAFSTTNLAAEEISKEKMEKILPKYLRTNNAGTEFYMTFHPCWQSGGANNAMKIYISSGEATKVTLEIPAFGYEDIKTTIPNGIIEYTLSPSTAAMYPKSDRQPPDPEKVWKGRGIIIKAEKPIIAYGVTRYQATSDGYLAIPTAGLGKNYQVASYGDPGEDDGVQWLTSYTSVVAAHDKTDVYVTFGGTTETWFPSKAPDGRVLANGEYGYGIGDRTQRRMNKGDVWLIPSRGHNADLSGTIIDANKPVSVISGSFCAYIPLGTPACDYIIEQELPTNTWGTKYHVSPIIKRQKFSWVKIFAKESLTTFYRNGFEFGTLAQPGYEEHVGFISRRLQDSDKPNAPVTLSANKPFSITQFNPGQNDDGIESDPFQLILTPIEQYQTSVIFNTPGVRGGASFRENYLNLVFLAEEDGSIPDDLEWGLANTSGEFVWKKVANLAGGAGMRFTDPDMDENGRHYYVKQIALPDPEGVYRFQGEDPFAGYAYGFDWYDSYGFPVSVALADLSVPDSLAPRLDYTISCLGNIEGVITDEPEFDSENRSNLRYIELDDETFNYNWRNGETPDFEPGVDFNYEFNIDIVDPTQDGKAVIYATDRAGNDTVFVINYYTTDLSILKSREDWGLIASHEDPITKTFTLVNNRDKEVTFSQIEVGLKSVFDDEEGDNIPYQGFVISNLPDIENPIQPNQEIEFDVTFDPSTVAEGTFQDSIGVRITIDGDVCYYRFLSRIRAQIGSPAITVSDIEFPPTTVNATANARQVTITNPGSTDLIITDYTPPTSVRNDNGDPIYTYNGPVFDALDNGNEFTIASGQTSTYFVEFTPELVQQYPDQIEFISNADIQNPVHDPIGLINGSGQMPGLDGDYINWERRRVNLDKYANYPHRDFPIRYIADGAGNDIVQLSNDGSAATRITAATVQEDENGAAFMIDTDGGGPESGLLPLNDENTLRNWFVGRTVPEAGGILEYPIYFDPRVEGVHRLLITFDAENITNPATIELDGTGIYPQIEITDINFTPNDPAIAMDAPIQASFTISCLDWGEFSDNVEIRDLVVVNNGTISDDGASYGTEAMMYNKALTGLPENPLLLAPGETATFEAYFAPQDFGDFEAQIETFSDASNDVISTWEGTALDQDWSIGTDNAELCVSQNQLLTVPVSNNATGALVINDVRLVDDNGNDYAGNTYSIVSVNNIPIDQFTTFELLPDAEIDITVEYAPLIAVQTNALVQVTTDALTNNVKTGEVSGNAYYYERTTSSDVSQDVIDLNQGEQTVDYTIYIDDSNEDMNFVTDATTLNVTVTYPTEFLGIVNDDGGEEENINIGGAQPLNDFVITGVERRFNNDDKTETVTLTIEGTQPITSAGRMEILRIRFYGYLLSPNTLPEKLNATITHTVTDEEPCVNYVDPGVSALRFEQICVQDLRVVNIDPNDFQLKQINPNPVTAAGASIEFSVGLPNVHTQISVYNSAGKVVAELINQTLTSGSYSLALPDLPSGIYFYEMKSGPFNETKKVVVRK